MKSLQKRAAYSIIILLGISAVTWSFKAPRQEPKDKVVKIKESTVTVVDNALGGLSDYLDKSNLPQQEVRQAQNVIKNAYQTLHKDLTDSTLNKK